MTGACPLLCSNHDGVHGLVHACGPTQLPTSAGPSSAQTTTTFPASFRCWHSRRSRRYIVRTVYAKVRQAIAKVGSAIQAVRACSAATGTRAEPGALTSLCSATLGACSTSLRRLSCCSLRPPLACCSLRSPLACCSLRSPLACCSLRSPPRLLLSLRSPPRLRLLASLVASPAAARFARGLTCSFCSPPHSPCLLLISARAPDPIASAESLSV